MTTDRSTRKLVVILHADVMGSTTLVQRDETLAHEWIRDAFRCFSEKIQAYGGIPQEIRGDALLATFARASDAVSASLSFQAANTLNNETIDDGVRPEVRIGIAIGEVVIARESSFAYKGQSVKVRQVAEELGVRYVLQGSVRRAGEAMRITAQLIDALKGNEVWAERYDRELRDVFAVQSEVAR